MTFRDTVTIGAATLSGITPENRRATIAVDGPATAEVIREACRWAFEDLGLHRVQAWLAAGDPAIAAYEAAGFMNEGTVRDKARRDGGWQDCVLLGLLAGELA